MLTDERLAEACEALSGKSENPAAKMILLSVAGTAMSGGLDRLVLHLIDFVRVELAALERQQQRRAERN